MSPIRVPLVAQITYMERHRDKGLELVKTSPGAQGALDTAEAIILTLTAYQAFEDEIKRMERVR